MDFNCNTDISSLVGKKVISKPGGIDYDSVYIFGKCLEVIGDQINILWEDGHNSNPDICMLDDWKIIHDFTSL